MPENQEKKKGGDQDQNESGDEQLDSGGLEYEDENLVLRSVRLVSFVPCCLLGYNDAPPEEKISPAGPIPCFKP